MAKRATISDVAKTTHFSVMTVSPVVRNTKHVKDSNRNRVLTAISQHNDHPDFSVRTLSNNITRNKHFVDLFTYFKILDRGPYTCDYSLMTGIQSMDPSDKPVKMTGPKVDGLMAALFQEKLNYKIPHPNLNSFIIYSNNNIDRFLSTVNSIVVDRKKIGLTAVKKLFKRIKKQSIESNFPINQRCLLIAKP